MSDATAWAIRELRARASVEFVDELWDHAVFTPHGIVRGRELTERPRFGDPAHIAATELLAAEDEEYER